MAMNETWLGAAVRGLGIGMLIAIALSTSACQGDRGEAASDAVSGVAQQPTPEAPQREIGIYGMAMKTSAEIEALKARAGAGNAEAIIEAISTFNRGIGVARDPSEALKFARQGAEMGLPEAKVRLANLLLRDDEEGITPNKDEGLRLLNELAAQGNESAVRNLAYEEEPSKRREMLLAYDRDHGIKDVSTVFALVDACIDEAWAAFPPSEKTREALTCARTWLDRADEVGDVGENVRLAYARWALSEAAAVKGIAGFGDVGSLVERGSGLSASDEWDARWISMMMLARSEYAIEGTHVAKNDEVAREYALKASTFEDDHIRSRAFDVLRRVSSVAFKDERRAYGWALLRKSVTEPEEWLSLDETILGHIESKLSPDERLAVQRAVAAWTPGEDLPLPSADGGEGSEETSSDPVSGTAFLVSDDGFALTNAHVAKGCKTIKDTAGGVAVLVAMDEANDLAAIRFGGYDERSFARLEAGAKLPRVGDRIAVFGFPLSEVLASTGNLTAGEVSANAGLGNNSSMFQISAPIQPGSSGSPVLSMRGNVAGVISSTASTVRLAQATGTIAQNLNFAINKDTVVGFLRSNGIPFEEAGDGFFSGRELEVAEIGERAREWTIRVECQR